MALDTVTPSSKAQFRAGWALTALVGLFMIFDGVIKLVPIAAVTEALAPLGFRTDPVFERGLGVLGLLCTTLYLIPRTSILGCILLTAYYGGAISAHLRVGSPVFSHLLFGLYLGLMAWGGLWFRNANVRGMIPLSSARRT